VGCNCGHDNCKIDEFFFKKNPSEEESLKPWERPQETVSGIKKEEVRLKGSFLILNTQELSASEAILKKKREEEKKALSLKAN
jgi:hypothetical protein